MIRLAIVVAGLGAMSLNLALMFVNIEAGHAGRVAVNAASATVSAMSTFWFSVATA